MARCNTYLIMLAFIATGLAGCGTSAPSRFYTLASTAASDGAPAVHATVTVEPVSVPAIVDEPQLVVQVAPNRVEVEEFNRWAAPLNEGIAQAVAMDLTVLLGSAEVTSTPLANFNPDYRVTISIQRFESVEGQAAVVEAVWAVRSNGGGETSTGRTVARETVQGEGFDALVAAHSRALARVSGDIAAAIRAEAAAKPERQYPLQGETDSSGLSKLSQSYP